jgi:ribonuclease HI
LALSIDHGYNLRFHSVFIPTDHALAQEWKNLSRDERRLAEKIETACKLAEMVDGSLLCYCDGGADGNGANGVCGAVGWGTSMLRKHIVDGGSELELLDELWGQIEMDTESDWYLGAERANNNTAELTGIIESLAMLKAEGGHDSAVIAYDSEYAAKATQGRKGKTNHKLIETAQRMLAQERERRVGGVTFVHVFAHNGEVWNEHADLLVQYHTSHDHAQHKRGKHGH